MEGISDTNNIIAQAGAYVPDEMTFEPKVWILVEQEGLKLYLKLIR